MKDSAHTGTSSGAPTSARYIVLYFAVSLAIITYVDRVCISKATPDIQRDLGLDKIQMGWALTAFSIAYALFEIPGGWLGDKIGPRKVLMRVVTMWSIFTIATGWARNLWSLIIYRFLFGVGEAGCFPNLTKAFTLWFHAGERVRVQGIMWLSARWGGAFTPLLVGWMLAGKEGGAGLALHYKWVFLIFGVLGIIWAVVFYSWFRDHPHEHPSVNAAELAEIGHTDRVGEGHAMPWKKLLSSSTVWMLWMQYFFMSYAWYFLITWFPTYLAESFPHLSEIKLSLLACIPLFFGGIGCFLAGYVAAPFEKRYGRSKARRVVAVGAFCVSGVMMILSPNLAAIPVLSVIAIGLASFASDLTLPGSWGACMEVGGRYTGALSGSMNMVGNAGGALTGIGVALIQKHWGKENWSMNMYLFAIAYFCAAVCWIFINSDERLQDDPAHA